MTDREIILVKIEDKEFILLSDSVIDIFSKNGENYVQYNGDLFRLNNKYELPNKFDNKASISIKKLSSPHVDVAVHYKSDYSILYTNKDYTIEPGDYGEIGFHHKADAVLTVYKNRETIDNKNLDIRMSVNNLEDSISKKDKETIKNQMSSMYSDTANGVKTRNSNNGEKTKYYTDLGILAQADRLDCLDFIDEGSHRDVYEIKNRDALDINIDCPDDVVIKLAKIQGGIDSNKKEYETWQAVQGTDLEKHFCPIVNRGPDYKYIIMKKAGELLFDKYVEGFDSGKIEDKIRDKISNSINLEDAFSTYGFDIHHKNLCKDPKTGDYILIDYPYGGNFEYIDE